MSNIEKETKTIVHKEINKTWLSNQDKKQIRKNAQRVFSKITTNCSNEQFYNQYIKDNPQSYQYIKDILNIRYKETKVDKAIKDYFINLCNKQRSIVKNAIIHRKESQASMSKIQIEKDDINKCKTIEELKPYYKSIKPKVRAVAAHTLQNKRFNPQEATAVLERLLRDGTRNVRKQARISLEKINKRIGTNEII